VMKSGKVVVDRRHARPNGAVGGAAAPHGGM
jgi:hypothetical protein